MPLFDVVQFICFEKHDKRAKPENTFPKTWIIEVILLGFSPWWANENRRFTGIGESG
ncbi:hypothetical protein [Aestuariibacter sp. A3R04]|uniref:hypothetical protein n=1 Tax=Aestuariibacter sp. A3R04 TaxID=2841571 RepID=UPI001C08F8D1|nr:hypothetical protein [Aestuariibacter sp. A3R04]MBU3021286.1 hypothetical protein [Aestuariibacter sp. A3R04]